LVAGPEIWPQVLVKTTQGNKKGRRKTKFLRRTTKKHAGQLKMQQEQIICSLNGNSMGWNPLIRQLTDLRGGGLGSF